MAARSMSSPRLPWPLKGNEMIRKRRHSIFLPRNSLFEYLVMAVRFKNAPKWGLPRRTKLRGRDGCLVNTMHDHLVTSLGPNDDVDHLVIVWLNSVVGSVGDFCK